MRPERLSDGSCSQCGRPPEAYHLESCSCTELGHEWVTTVWKPDIPHCCWCGKPHDLQETVVDQRLVAHLRAIVEYFEADDSEGAFQYAAAIPVAEARAFVDGLRMIADATVLAAFPDSDEAALLEVVYGTGS